MSNTLDCIDKFTILTTYQMEELMEDKGSIDGMTPFKMGKKTYLYVGWIKKLGRIVFYLLVPIDDLPEIPRPRKIIQFEIG